MQVYILELFDNVSLENFVIAFLIFLITQIIKIPIKKKTSPLEESKRKFINNIFVMIPLFLSLLTSLFFYKLWDFQKIMNCAFNSWLISLSIYAIYERLKIIVKYFIEKIDSKELNQTQEELETITKTIDEVSSSIIKSNEKLLNKTKKDIDSLTKTIEKLLSNQDKLNIEKLFEANSKLKYLENKKIKIENEIEKSKEKGEEFIL